MAAKRGKAAPGKGALRVGRTGIPTMVIPGTRRPDIRWQKAAVIRAMRRKEVFTIVLACKLAGISTQSFYRWQKDDTDFAAEVEAANEDITQRLEQSAHEQSVGIGVEAPVPSLMQFLLKARRPLIYREATEAKLDLTSPNGAQVSFTLKLGDSGNNVA